MKTILTIAGSDCSGGAGIQADIKTIAAHKMYAMSAITALTAQNTAGVCGIMDVPPEFIAKQLDCIFTDIFPDAVKIGMVTNRQIIETIAGKLAQYEAQNVVVDPVMVSTSGSPLLSGKAHNSLTSKLFSAAALITPNIPEAEVLCGFRIKGRREMIKAAKHLSAVFHCAILVKGGHLDEEASDLLCQGDRIIWYSEPRIQTSNTHGTGCTLSSAIACGLAAGFGMDESIRSAKAYLTGALKAGLDLGKGNGPLDHMYCL